MKMFSIAGIARNRNRRKGRKEAKSSRIESKGTERGERLDEAAGETSLLSSLADEKRRFSARSWRYRDGINSNRASVRSNRNQLQRANSDVIFLLALLLRLSPNPRRALNVRYSAIKTKFSTRVQHTRFDNNRKAKLDAFAFQDLQKDFPTRYRHSDKNVCIDVVVFVYY